MILVASMPSMQGMAISIRTISGRSALVFSTASMPSTASPQTRKSEREDSKERTALLQDLVVVGYENACRLHLSSPGSKVIARWRHHLMSGATFAYRVRCRERKESVAAHGTDAAVSGVSATLCPWDRLARC